MPPIKNFNFKPSYNELRGFEARHSGNWIAKFSGNLSSLNVINKKYAPIMSIDIKLFNSIDESLNLLPNGITINTIKGFERPQTISATFFETDDIQVSHILRKIIKELDTYTKNRVLAYSDLNNFAGDLIITVYKKDGSGVADNLIYTVIPKNSGEYGLNQDGQLVTFNVDFLVVGFNQA